MGGFLANEGYHPYSRTLIEFMIAWDLYFQNLFLDNW